jgi:DNA processing protein
VVVEAARRSGSLITARFAGEQGREVFAVPGSPLDPRAEGTNDLLRQGAHLCASAEDVTSVLVANEKIPPPRADLFGEAERPPDEEPLIDELDLFSLREAAARPLDFAEAAEPPPAEIEGEAAQNESPPAQNASDRDPRALIVSLLGPSPVAVDELIRIAGLTAREVQGVLTELDLAGRLERHGGNFVSLL